jgi:Sulfotransferase domain.
MLGSLPDAFAVGELRYLWARGIVERRLCGCGQPVPECPVWGKILAQAFNDLTAADVDRAIDAVNWLGDASSLPRILRRGERGRFPELGDLAARLGELYRTTAAVTGATTIIDSSKPPTYGWFVGTLPEIELSVIHLVRDPRGTAFSWQHPKTAIDRPGGGLMPRKPPWKSALSWDLWNTATELLFRPCPERLLRVRYEDLVQDPDVALCSVLEFLGYPADALDSLNGRRFTRGPSHTVAGNPSRLAVEPTMLTLDAEWQAGMTTKTRRVVTALSTPLLLHYGYPVRHRHDSTVIDLEDPPKMSVSRPVRGGRPSPDRVTRRS